jgi:hypothetical protein
MVLLVLQKLQTALTRPISADAGAGALVEQVPTNRLGVATDGLHGLNQLLVGRTEVFAPAFQALFV